MVELLIQIKLFHLSCTILKVICIRSFVLVSTLVYKPTNERNEAQCAYCILNEIDKYNHS